MEPDHNFVYAKLASQGGQHQTGGRSFDCKSWHGRKKFRCLQNVFRVLGEHTNTFAGHKSSAIYVQSSICQYMFVGGRGNMFAQHVGIMLFACQLVGREKGNDV